MRGSTVYKMYIQNELKNTVTMHITNNIYNDVHLYADACLNI